MKKNKGITLIALVITIIVLLILAGVAIAMLSGENGILRKAAESKTKTEEAQKQEEKTLTDMELTTNFLTKKSNYRCSYGYVTGMTVENNSVTDTVSKLENALPEGYKVALKYEYVPSTKKGEDKVIEEVEKDRMIISTGMAIQKDGQEVARTVVFGDLNCDGNILPIDSTTLAMHTKGISNFKNFQKLAANVYDDDEIDTKDINLLYQYLHPDGSNVDIVQSRNIKMSQKNIRRWNTKIQGYINSLNQDSGYEFEYDEEADTYKIKGVPKDKTAGELINELPNSDELKVLDESKKEVTEDVIVSNGYYIRWTSKDENNSDLIITWSVETK